MKFSRLRWNIFTGSTTGFFNSFSASNSFSIFPTKTSAFDSLPIFFSRFFTAKTRNPKDSLERVAEFVSFLSPGVLETASIALNQGEKQRGNLSLDFDFWDSMADVDVSRLGTDVYSSIEVTGSILPFYFLIAFFCFITVGYIFNTTANTYISQNI